MQNTATKLIAILVTVSAEEDTIVVFTIEELPGLNEEDKRRRECESC